MLFWLYGSGFPKSLDVSKAIDKQDSERHERALPITRTIRDAMKAKGLSKRHLNEFVVGSSNDGGSAQSWTTVTADGAHKPRVPTWEQWLKLKELLDLDDSMDAEVWRLNGRKGQPGEAWAEREVIEERKQRGSQGGVVAFNTANSETEIITAPATPEAQKWQGWGTALKPAHEPIIIARKPYIESERMRIEVADATVFHGSCLDVLKTLPDNSVDSVVTDPPYGLSNTDPAHVAQALSRWGAGERDYIPEGKGFMGKAWDAFVPPPAVWDECLRVLKPGGHMLVFAGSRTFDLMALSIRLAGFEIRDSVAWLYGSGFPKSLDVSKAIDKAAGVEREVVATYKAATMGDSGRYNWNSGGTVGATTANVTIAATPEAQQWQGWGTALKPAFEPIVVARKPLIGTVAENVLTHGTGALNIDGTRIGSQGGRTIHTKSNGASRDRWEGNTITGEVTEHGGRWPSNVMLDEFTAALVDEQSGVTRDGVAVRRNGGGQKIWGAPNTAGAQPDLGYAGVGGASRFFYVAKASKRDRNEGLDGLPETSDSVGAYSGVEGFSGRTQVDGKWVNTDNERKPRQNFHPTVKPTGLMRQLVRLVTPPGGTVLDPFTGSGSTGKAAILEGFQFVGVELTEEYLPIIEGRLQHAADTVAQDQAAAVEAKAEALF